MKPFILIFLLATFIYPVFAGYPTSHWAKDKDAGIKDTIPDMCSILPGREIDSLHVFGNPLTKTFPDPNAGENYWGCYYQFYKPDDYPQLAVRLIKWGSKQEAADDFRMQVSSAVRINGVAPERLLEIADSAYFNYDMEDILLCDECGLVAIRGVYSVYISFKGQSKTVTRDSKIMSALKILQMMYNRIPGFGPLRIRSLPR